MNLQSAAAHHALLLNVQAGGEMLHGTGHSSSCHERVDVMGRHACSAPGAGATEIQDVTSRLQRGCSFNLSVTASTAAAAAGEHCTRAGSFSTKGRANETKDAASKAAPPKKQRQCKAAQPQRQPQTHAQPKGRRNFLVGGRSAPARSFCSGCSLELTSMLTYPHLVATSFMPWHAHQAGVFQL